MNTFRKQAIFKYIDDLLAAIRKMQQEGIDIEAVHSPIANEEIASLMEKNPSPIRFFALTGGILGIVVGFALSIYTAVQWNFIVSGKPPVSPVAYVIVGFEFCILFAVIFNVVGLLLLTRLPKRKLPDYYDPRVTEDRFSLLVCCSESNHQEIDKMLNEVGAEEIHAV